MTRIFLTLCLVSLVVIGAAFWLGFEIGDGTTPDRTVQNNVSLHMLTGLVALLAAVLVHALVLTYFMGTGRWLEETSNAYRLPDKWLAENRRLKYRTVPAMVLCILLLIIAGSLGAAGDPAAATGFRGWGEFSAATLHMLAVMIACGINLAVNLLEYAALERNGAIVNEVLAEVRRMRIERGLEV